jgi:hypothetical protein
MKNKASLVDPKSWPPGSLISYHIPVGKNYHREGFSALGIVVSNVEGFIRVVWGAHCHNLFETYEVVFLNSNVIDKVNI